MAQESTIARPYALAVLKLAREQGDYDAWSDQLACAAAVARDPVMQALVRSPRAGADQLAQLIIEVCGERLLGEGRNLIRLLAHNRRLAALPAIAGLYEALRAEAEGTVEAEVVSAKPLDEAQKRMIAEALKARLGREVTVKCKTDETLVGGAVIRAGDLVIDGSVRGRVRKLARALMH